MGQQKTKLIGAEVEEKPKKKDLSRRPVSPSQGGAKADKYAVEKEISKTKEEIKEEFSTKLAEKEVKKEKVRPPKVRSARYKSAKSLIDSQKLYPLEEAIELVKKTSTVKFDASVEVHILMEKGKKETEGVRGLISFPHGTGRKLKVVILDEKKIEEIERTKKTDFDLALASPELQPKLQKIAKILGPKGLMPNPKSGTLTLDPQKMAQEIAKGKIEYKTDSFGIIHLAIGKVSWDSQKLVDNLQTLLSALPVNKIKRVYVASSMGPSLKVEI